MGTLSLHGVEVKEVPGATPPISTVSSSVIGLIGTAATGKEDEPILITSLAQGEEIFTDSGTIYPALESIFSQTSAKVIVVNIGKSKETDAGSFEDGIDCLMRQASHTGFTPKILIAPGAKNKPAGDKTEKPEAVAYTAKNGSKTVRTISASSSSSYTTASDVPEAVALKLIEAADFFRAIAVLDADVSKMDDYEKYLETYASDRAYMVYPQLIDLNGETKPASPYVAGLIAKTDAEFGFWYSPSNKTLRGVKRPSIPISFTLGNGAAESDANFLNQINVATFINQDGVRLWGNRTLSTDATWQFLPVRRTADMINDSLLYAHMWAVDKLISRNYIDAIVASVNTYLRSLKALGAIIDGKCYINRDLNNDNTLKEGHLYVSFDFTPPYPLEHITFNSQIVDTYLSEVFS